MWRCGDLFELLRLYPNLTQNPEPPTLNPNPDTHGIHANQQTYNKHSLAACRTNGGLSSRQQLGANKSAIRTQKKKGPPKNLSSSNSRAWRSAKSAITGVCFRLTGLFILANFDTCAVALAGVVKGGGRSSKRGLSHCSFWLLLRMNARIKRKEKRETGALGRRYY